MAWLCGVLILLADQWIKRSLAGRCPVALGWHVQLRCLPHHDPSYRSGPARVVFISLWLLAVACAATLHWLTPGWFRTTAGQIGLGALFGGSASNLIDIVALGYVRNVVDLGWWRVFNLADAAIVCGLAAALVL